ncbi:STN domain-containing protein [Steroidobacter sp. S1-65]|uniref:STN domain-containing protein n=1 Tax=Steroidobacter gossypii TaxID=2805490 RepID=A0ABS1X612_9GAMM|nr:STN domain-containing protein [Steroidobacter gossypii]MBM0108649.1 STN domain-containing protein [Steroidobacter gossypii]
MTKAARSLLALTFSGLIAPPATSAAERYTLHIDRQPVVRTLAELSKQTRLQIVGMFRNEGGAASRLTGPLTGEFTIECALQMLLADSDLTFVRVNANTIAVMAKPAEPEPGQRDRS